MSLSLSLPLFLSTYMCIYIERERGHALLGAVGHRHGSSADGSRTNPDP